MNTLYQSLYFTLITVFFSALIPFHTLQAQQQSSPASSSEYVRVPVNIGFVTPLSVGNITQAASGKPVLSAFSLHLIGHSNNALDGIDISGLGSMFSDDVRGVQIAGVANIVQGNAQHLQLAGLGNLVQGRFSGLQAACVLNIASSVDGVQCAGLVNYTPEIKGTQIGLVNVANHVKGAQVGFLNITDDNEDAMIGLININTKYGLRGEVFTDELRFIRAGLRTGNASWYSIITAGIQPFTDEALLWSLGYGLGKNFYLGQKEYLDVSLHLEAIFQGGFEREMLTSGHLARLRTMIGYDIAPSLSVFAGPTLNIMASRNLTLQQLTASFLPGTNVVVAESGIHFLGIENGWLRTWVGLTGGIRF